MFSRGCARQAHMNISVIGTGAVSCLGKSWPDTWSRLLSGDSGIRRAGPLNRHIPEDTLVADVPGLDRNIWSTGAIDGASGRLCREVLAQLQASCECPSDWPIFGASTYGESDVLLDLVQRSEMRWPSPSEQWRSVIIDSTAAAYPIGTWVYSSCTSSIHSLLLAALDVEAGDVEHAAIAVGVDSLSVLGINGFRRIGASSTTGCRPFHGNRDGTVIGEGAAAIAIGHASLTGRNVAARMVGIGLNCEASHPTRPSEKGEGLELAIRAALKMANHDPSDVRGIVLHGTGTQANDAAEMNAVGRVFGFDRLPATSIKGALGHTMGAAGIFNCLVAIQACTDRLLPPTISDGSATCTGMRLVTGVPHAIDAGPLVVNTSGFGGNNAVVVFEPI